MPIPIPIVSLKNTAKTVMGAACRELMTHCNGADVLMDVKKPLKPLSSKVSPVVKPAVESLVNMSATLRVFSLAVITCISINSTVYAQSGQSGRTTKQSAKPTAAKQSATQGAKLQKVSATTMPTQQMIDIRVTKYELALVQDMAEMCPSMLNARQRTQFYEAYNNQLRAFIPSANNPEEVLVYLSSQRDYRTVLQNVRTWTASFPKEENRELCAEFANVSRAF